MEFGGWYVHLQLTWRWVYKASVVSWGFEIFLAVIFAQWLFCDDSLRCLSGGLAGTPPAFQPLSRRWGLKRQLPSWQGSSPWGAQGCKGGDLNGRNERIVPRGKKWWLITIYNSQDMEKNLNIHWRIMAKKDVIYIYMYIYIYIYIHIYIHTQ